MKKDLRNVFNGAAFGVTLLIPGVSSMMVAIILGFYDELLRTVNHFRRNIKESIRYIAAFAIGAAAGVIALSSAILFLLEEFSVPTMMFFMGLLIGVVPMIYARAKGDRKQIAAKEIALAAVAAGAIIAMSFLGSDELSSADAGGVIDAGMGAYVFLAGLIGGATLVMPGVSGAFILLLMRLYQLVVGTIAMVGVYLANVGNLKLLQEIMSVLVPFGLGALVGFLGMARLMEKLLRDHSRVVYMIILGIVLGSIGALLADPIVVQSGTSTGLLAAGMAAFCAGGMIAYVLGEKGSKG